MVIDQTMLADRVSALDLPEGQYALFGDAALAAHGLVKVDRIELIVTVGLFDELRERGWDVGTDVVGDLLVGEGVLARREVAHPRHPSVPAMIEGADRVSGLPAVPLSLVRQHYAARGVSDDVIGRLRRIDEALGVRTSTASAAMPTRDAWRDVAGGRSVDGLSYVRGVLTAPARTFAAHRDVSMWSVAFGATCLATFAVFVGGVLAGAPAFVVLATPFVAGFSLLQQRLRTAVARRVCGGDPGLSGPTASQAAIVATLAQIPVVVALLLSAPILLYAAGIVALLAFFGMVGYLYSVAFGCSVARGVTGEIVGTVALTLATYAGLIVLAGLLGA